MIAPNSYVVQTVFLSRSSQTYFFSLVVIRLTLEETLRGSKKRGLFSQFMKKHYTTNSNHTVFNSTT